MLTAWFKLRGAPFLNRLPTLSGARHLSSLCVSVSSNRTLPSKIGWRQKTRKWETCVDRQDEVFGVFLRDHSSTYPISKPLLSSDVIDHFCARRSFWRRSSFGINRRLAEYSKRSGRKKAKEGVFFFLLWRWVERFNLRRSIRYSVIPTDSAAMFHFLKSISRNNSMHSFKEVSQYASKNLKLKDLMMLTKTKNGRKQSPSCTR